MRLPFGFVAKLPKLREHARAEAAPLETVPVHGGPDTAVTLRTHAELHH